MPLEVEELRGLIRDVVKSMIYYGPREARHYIRKLRDAGIVKDMHVGLTVEEMTEKRKLEWYAGQILSVWENGNKAHMQKILGDMEKWTRKGLIPG